MNSEALTKAYANLVTQLALVKAKEEKFFFLAEVCPEKEEEYFRLAMSLSWQWIKMNDLMLDLLNLIIKDVMDK